MAAVFYVTVLTNMCITLLFDSFLKENLRSKKKGVRVADIETNIVAAFCMVANYSENPTLDRNYSHVVTDNEIQNLDGGHIVTAMILGSLIFKCLHFSTSPSRGTDLSIDRRTIFLYAVAYAIFPVHLFQVLCLSYSSTLSVMFLLS